MPGYSVLARMMGRRRELGIFRQFTHLNLQSLLCMQAEIVRLEVELQQLVQYPGPFAGFDRSWEDVLDAVETENGRHWRDKLEQLRQKLDTYHAALLRSAQMNDLGKPRQYDLEFVRQWLGHQCGGDWFLQGYEAEPWEAQHVHDLVVLARGEPGDALAECVAKRIAPVYHRLFGYRLHGAIAQKEFDAVWEYKREVFVQLGNVLCMLLSALVPTLSIVVLYYIKDMAARLGMMVAFSLLFSLVMTFVVQGRRVDVFAATTAFAAVQVVFVSVSNGGNSGNSVSVA